MFMKKSQSKIDKHCEQTPNDQAERQAGNATQPESSVTKSPKTVNPQAGGQFALAPLLSENKINRWVDKCGTPVIYKNGWKRQDDEILRQYPISCYLSFLSVRLLHKFRNCISRRIYGKQWKQYVSLGLCI